MKQMEFCIFRTNHYICIHKYRLMNNIVFLFGQQSDEF